MTFKETFKQPHTLPGVGATLNPNVNLEHLSGADVAPFKENDPPKPPNPKLEVPKADLGHAGVSNHSFMTAVFKELQINERPYVVSIYGDEIIGKPNWNGDSWHDKFDTCNPNSNMYFTLSTYSPVNGEFFRRKNTFFPAFGVYLDDVGTKGAGLERLQGCPPSYVIETSKDNFQAGYLFTQPTSNLIEIENFINTAASEGLCDPGAKGPAARLGRLPCAINGKRTPHFQCRLIEWHPELRYSLDEMYSGLGLAKISTAKKIVGSRSISYAVNHHAKRESRVYSPKSDENLVISACKAKGIYKRDLGSGKHDIACPWVDEHSNSIDSGTVFFEPSEASMDGAFKCQHGHCDKRRLLDFLEKIEVSLDEARNRSTILLIAGQFDSIVDAAEIELAGMGDFYQRGSVICKVVTDPGSSVTAISAVNVPELTRALSKTLTWARRNGDDVRSVDPSHKHLAALHSSETYKHLPVLLGLTRQPYFRGDGSLVTASGYDVAMKLYGVFEEKDFFVPESPSREAAVAALNELKLLLTEFGFASEHDRAAALGLMITSAIRISLDLAPMGHIKAPQISSGKSYLCDLIAAFSGPSNTAAFAFPTNDEECSKLLLAAFFGSPSVIKFDNLTSDLIPYKSLCSAITEQNLTGRILGVSQMRTVSTRCLLLSSGNNVDAVRDMTRRVLTVNLDPGVEMPATRSFNENPLATVLKNREEYVSLALTIVRAYIVAGSPVQGCMKKLGSFDHWSALVRSPLVWLGLPDPATSMFTTMATDPDREQLGRLMDAWEKRFGDQPTSVSDVVKAIEKDIMCFTQSDLLETVREVAEQGGKLNRRTLGRWISRHQGQLVDGRKFMRGSKSAGSERWLVKKSGSISEFIDPSPFDLSPLDDAIGFFSRDELKRFASESELDEARMQDDFELFEAEIEL